MNAKPLQFLVPATVISFIVFSVFGALGLCGMADCLGSGAPTLEDRLLGVGVVAAAAIPFATSLFLVCVVACKKRIGRLAAGLVWAIALIVGGLGIFQAIVDPGDTWWAGLPLLAVSGLLIATVLSLSARAPDGHSR